MILLLASLAAADEADLDAIFAALSSSTSLQADFTQTQHRAVLARPLESRGSLAFERPDKLRWQIDTPSKAVFVMDGPDLVTSMPDLGVTERLSLASRPEFMGVVEGLTVWLRADAERVKQDYDASLVDGEVVLTPKTDDLGRWVQQFTLSLSEDHRYVTRVAILEPDGDRVEMHFEHVRLDEPVPAGQFSVQ